MLLSWINAGLSRTQAVAGIHIGRRQVHGAILTRHNSEWMVEDSSKFELSSPLFDVLGFDVSGEQAAESDLVAALRQIVAGFKRGFMPIRVALPDTVIRSSVFELDEIPRAGKPQQDLLRWRFATMLQRNEDALVCTGQALGEAAGKKLLFAQALEKNVHALVQRALQQAEIQPWSLNAQSACQHNAFHDAYAQGGGALVSMDAESWGFQLWDASKRLRYVRSRWRDGALDFEQMGSEIERVIRAQASTAHGFQVERLYIAGVGEEADLFQQALNQKLLQQIDKLQFPHLSFAAGVAITQDQLNPAILAAISNEN